MKKISLFSVCFLFLLILSGCGIKEEAMVYVQQGDKLLEEEKYDDALKAYAKAYQIDDHNDIFERILKAREQKFHKLYDDYNQFKQERKFKEAKALIPELQKFKEVLDEETAEELKNDKKQLEKMIEKQKILDDYILWAKPYILSLNQMSNDWIRYSRALTLGTKTKLELQQNIGNLLLKNQEVMGAIENKNLNIDPSLAEVHKILLDITLQNESSFTSVLGGIKSNETPEEIVDKGAKLENMKQRIADFTNAIRSYAEEKGLRDTFNEIVTKDTSVNTSNSK